MKMIEERKQKRVQERDHRIDRELERRVRVYRETIL